MIDTEALRKKVIDLAIQGKLTQQLPEDGDAEDLYTTIQEKKEKLIKEGKIKKEKQQLGIMEEEIPFIIPSSWKWCRLESIFNFIDYRGATPNKIAKGVPFVTAKNVRQGYTDYSIKEYISEEDYTKRQSRGISHKGDLLFTTEAPMGYVAIADLERFSAGQRLITLQQYTDDPLINNKYYMYCISASFFQKQLEEKCSGTTVKGIKADRLKLFLIPLPPIEEQCRIVNLLDSVVNQLAIIDELKQQYESDREILKGKIIDAGIRGKLTEQLPEDGNAEELFAQIQNKKAKLIEEGKLRKTRGFKTITEDEEPYMFPNSWKICYIDDVAFVTKLAGFEYTKYIADSICDQGVPLFKGKNIQKGELVLEFESYIPTEVSDELPRSQVNKKCLLTPYVGTIGNIALFDGAFKAHLGSNVGKIEILNPDNVCLMEEYLLMYFRSDIGYSELNKHRKATAQDSISIDAIRNVIIAIPPIEEQKRISNIINELLSLIAE